MTIYNFDWYRFWDSFRYISWYEILMLVCFWVGWRRLRKNSLKSGAKNLGSSPAWFVFAACVFGTCHKIFVNLDLSVFLYVFGALGALVNILARRDVQKRVAERESISARREGLARIETDAVNGRPGSHSHHGRDGVGHRHHHSHRVDEGATDAIREPKFENNVTFDSEFPASETNSKTE